MKLAELALQKINTKLIRRRLMIAFDVTEKTVNLWISENQKNGPLTLTAALKIIKETTGLAENDILIQEPESAHTK